MSDPRHWAVRPSADGKLVVDRLDFEHHPSGLWRAVDAVIPLAAGMDFTATLECYDAHEPLEDEDKWARVDEMIRRTRPRIYDAHEPLEVV